MMLHPEWWPNQLPVRHLCLEHTSETVERGVFPRTAILLEGEHGEWLVMPWKDDNPTELEGLPERYASVDAVLAAGWEVD
jgi:hypothetical protein